MESYIRVNQAQYMSELSQVCVMESYTQARYMSELSQQMEEQKARKAAEEQAQVETEK